MEPKIRTEEDLVEHRRLPLASDTSASHLAEELERHLRGEVRFDDGYRALYATDASNYRQTPIGVVIPRGVNDVVVAVALCRDFRVPIVARGGGTSLAGQGCNAAVLLDFSKYLNGILEIDPEHRFARVEPGVVLDELRARAEEFHLTFGPDPSTHNHCTLGGMIGNNSCGVHSMMAGCTSENVQEPGLSRVLKWVAGVEPRRQLPEFAPVTFKEWWRTRPAGAEECPEVLLWVDTWSNHFQPGVPVAAVDALEHAGFRVVVPRKSLCCGRPLYDYGMLDLAKRMLEQVMDTLRPALRAGVPIVGLEPSCMSVFRDELPNLFPDDPDARRLKNQSFMLGDFLLHHVKDWKPPRLERKALVQGHCHHKAVLDFKQDVPLLRKMGLDTDVLDAGCCGMAGAFGYEREHYAVSVACSERALSPAIRRAPDDALIVADGFSCRGQIEQQTSRRALHTAQVLQMARMQGPEGPCGPHPEVGYADVRLPVPWTRKARNAALLAGGAAATYAIIRGRRRRPRFLFA